MALREPSFVERHIADHFVPYAAVLGFLGTAIAVLGVVSLGGDTVTRVLWVAVGLWIVSGPWSTRRQVRRWDDARRGGSGR